MRIAVVIPTWNEAEHVGRLVESLRAASTISPIIVADCNSTDGTEAIARQIGARVVRDESLDCRGAAMDAGAKAAMAMKPAADVLWFLHADSHEPTDWHDLIERALADPRVVAGAFEQRFITRGCTWFQKWRLRLVSALSRFRYHITGIYFGDQGLFVRAEALERIGGVPRQSLLEDAELCRRLRKIGTVVLLPQRLAGSPRRFLHHGIIRQMLYDTLIILAASMGIGTSPIHGWYNREKG